MPPRQIRASRGLASWQGERPPRETSRGREYKRSTEAVNGRTRCALAAYPACRGRDKLQPMRRFARLASALAALAVAASASAETRPSPTALAGTAARNPAIVRLCTTPGCAGGTSSPWNQVAGFGAAALAAIWLARRRHAPTR